MRCFIIVISLLTVATTYAQTSQPSSFRPKDGFIPNAETALKVGEAVLIPVYGEKTILDERPFKATLNRDVWTVEGTVPCDGPVGVSCEGGAALVRISKTSGQILFMMHYK
jgi:hypothetical protein